MSFGKQSAGKPASRRIGDLPRKVVASMTSLALADLVVIIGACVATGLLLRYLWREDPDGAVARERVNSDSWPRPRITIPLDRDN
jgi:hypothetical protein